LDSELQQITSLVDGDNAAQAEPRLKTYLDAHPDSLAARMLYAKLLYGQQRYWSCIDQSRKVVETDPNNAEAWHNLGNSYQQIHKPDKALESYKRFVALSQDPQPQYQTLINLLQEQTRNPEPLQLRVTGDGTYLRDVTEQGLFRWGHTSPITVFINPGTPVKEYRPEFDEALRQAFDDWAEATNHRFTFVLQQVKDKPDIEISWTDDMHAADWTAEAGDTHLQSGPEGLTSATIRLLTVDPFKQAPLGKEALHAVCLHEIGHALGLQGHSGREGDIMFPILHEDSISARDRDTLIALYDPNLKVSAQLPNTDGYGRPLPNTQLAQRLITDGSNAAVAGDWKHAKEMLEQALALEAASKDESMKMARSNLAVCCNNLAIQDGLPQEDAMKLLYEALYWKSDYEQAQKNMVSMFPERPHPKTAGEHAKAGDDRMKLGDLYGAIVEYRLALAGKDDPAIRTKLTLCVAKLTPKK
jgi:predicted Zn-dependent protease